MIDILHGILTTPWVMITALIVLGLLGFLAATRFGTHAVAIVGFIGLLLMNLLLARRSGKVEAEAAELEKDLENEVARSDAIVRADKAADAVRDAPADKLREHDKFERE